MTLAIQAIERFVEVDGARLAPDVDVRLESVVVVDRLAMPDTFVLAFRDQDRDILSRGGLNVGKRIRVATTSPTSDVPEVLIDGEITSVEADYDLLGTRAIVRGYDLSHRLASGRKTATFQNAKYSDIARRIAEDAGLEADVEDSGETLEHVLQPNLSDLEFLYGLARRIGFDCRVDGQKLRFNRPTPSMSAPAEGDFDSTDPTQLVWGDTLLEFRARMSAAAQVDEVSVRGWDAANKKAVIGKAPATAPNAEISMTTADLAAAVGNRSLVVVDRPVETQAAADQIARARAEQVGSAAFEATAVAVGSPALKAGVAVSIANVDPALIGRWVISSSRHEFGAGAYRTHLEFSGRQDRSLHGLVAGGAGGSGGRDGAIAGVVTAIVTNIEDPVDQGRVKVLYPWLADEAESSWCRLAMPGAGKDYGAVWVPQVGDEVLVSFIQGDVSQLVVIGGLWNGEDTAPLGGDLFDSGTVRRSGFISRRGHKFVFFDAEDDMGIALITSENKFRVSLNETEGRLHIFFDGDLVIDGTGDIQLKTDGNIAIEAGGSLDLKAGRTATVKGATVALNP